MSLDVYLHEAIVCPHCGKHAGEGEQIYRQNVTHNLNTMAKAAGIYEACWRPEEIGVTRAAELEPLLAAGLVRLRVDAFSLRDLNPENGWGSYDGMVRFVESYLAACREHTSAVIRVCR